MNLAIRFATLASVIVLLGCGTGTYDDRMELALTELGKTSSFYEHLHQSRISVEGTGVSFQLPKIFDSSSKAWAEGQRDEGGELVAEMRIKPPFDLPGFRFCYERFGTSSSGRARVVYCYVAVVNAGQLAQNQLIQQIQTGIMEKFPSAPRQWDSIQLSTAEGTKIECRKTSVSGEHRFDISRGNGSVADMDGRMDVYIHSTDDYHILIGWRGNTDFAQTLNLFQSAPIAVGTLTVDPPAANENPGEGEPPPAES